MALTLESHCKIGAVRFRGQTGAPTANAGGHLSPGYDAAGHHRRLRGLTTATREINSLVRRYGRTIIARSRYLCANDAYFRNARESFVSGVVGSGIKPSLLLKDPADADLREAIQQAWLDWTDEADADGDTDFYGLQALVAGEVYEGGECFVRFRSRRPEDGLSVPLQLQVIPAEMLPLDRNEDLGPAGSIQSGIQFGPIGNKLAYHFLTRHPGSDFTTPADPNFYTVVPASEVLHVFRKVSGGQIRGIPATLSSIVPAAILNHADDAMLERFRQAANFVGVITTDLEEEDAAEAAAGGTDDGLLPGPHSTDPAGDWALEPGIIANLPPGESITFSQPPEAGNSYEPFQYRNLTRIAAGLDETYAAVTGDLRAASYSSQRTAEIGARRRKERVQHQVFAFKLCQPVWSRWFDAAVLAGAVPVRASEYARRRREFSRVRWIPPRFEWVDPLKDRQAEEIAVNNGWKARSDVIEAEGYDPEETDRRIAADQKRARELGIDVAITTRGTTVVPLDQPSDAPPPTDGTKPAAPKAQAGGVSITMETPWPHGEEVEVTAHDALGRVKRFVKKPRAAPVAAAAE